MTARAPAEKLKVHVMASRDIDAGVGVCRKCGPVRLALVQGFWRCQSQAPARIRHRLSVVDTEGKRAICHICGPTELVRKHGHWVCKAMELDVQSKHLRERYGITVEQYDEMFEQQDGCCAICKRDKGRLHVDHDHVTGKVRGLLCGTCNRGIGSLRDDVELLQTAINYLRAY